jgi:hypothetical protein
MVAEIEKRKARTVVQHLLDEMAATVRDYHPEVGRTGTTVDELIQGTALFPGGCGLWRGSALGGPMPEYFPDSPIMLVAHNYDSIAGHERYQQRGGEVDSSFWRILIGYLDGAGIDPADAFFTNALMGCKPGSATGKMPSVPGYEDQCLSFLRRQLEIVRPRVVIALGRDARRRLCCVLPEAQGLAHPSSWEFRPLSTRAERISTQSLRLAELVRTASEVVTA